MQLVPEVEYRSPDINTGTNINIYGTGQSTKGVHVNKWAFFDTVKHDAGDLDVSNWGHPRPLGQSGIFYNPVVGLVMDNAVQLQAIVHYSKPILAYIFPVLFV